MIYYVEDDESIRDLLLYALRQSGFEAEGFSEAASFLSALENRPLPELVLLDIMLPGEDGLSILTRIKQDSRTAQVPVVMLTAKGSEYDKVLGLDVGADDYVTKPFGVMELIARIKAILRRSGKSVSKHRFHSGGIELDDESHTVTANGRPVTLTFKEYELLRYLMVNEGIALDRPHLLDGVWGVDYYGGTRTVDAHIQTLRQKLGDCGDCIETIRGFGYRIGGKAR
mgnify:CR=1 FL=1